MLEPERLAAVLETPAGWTRESGPGYVLHREPQIDVRLAFAEAVVRGLETDPRTLPCTYLYDGEGSRIFEQITAQPEYYQTRTEDAILEAAAGSLRRRVGSSTVVELGSGSSAKTHNILAAWCHDGPARYVPIDVSEAALQQACQELTGAFPALTVEALATTYENGLPLAARLSPLILVFLGSTIGNFTHAQLDEFLDLLSGQLHPDDRLLLGVDRIKPTARLEAAYNDAAGWSARFTLNLFARMNRELGTQVPLDAVEHVAYYNEPLSRIEIYARFLREVRIEIPSLGRGFRLAPGEMVRTEISRKFRPDHVAANLSRFGFSLEEELDGTDDLFSVLLFRRRPRVPFAEGRRHSLQATLRRVRSATLDILAPLAEELEACGPGILNAITQRLQVLAEHEETWLVQALGEGSERPSAPVPEPGPPMDLDALLLRLAAIRRQSLSRLVTASLDPARPLSAGGQLHQQAARHESRIQELLLQDIQEHPDHPYDPVDEDTPPPRPDHAPVGELILIPGGSFPMGRAPTPEAEDDEQPVHRLEVPSFLMDAAPVTNGEFLAFMTDGGYRRKELWSAEGRSWLEHEQPTAPACWRQDPAEKEHWKVFSLGFSHALDPDRPVSMVSWYEADTFARWAGKRLPSEAEWEKAARWDPEHGVARLYPWGSAPPSGDFANLNHRLWQPVAVGSYPRGRSFYGCHQMMGDVWEWTSGVYEPYPRYESELPSIPGRDQFASGRRVLRGGSWASSIAAVTASTRRSSLAENRRMFAGFRCARSL
jgi:dimethylhistidine N-methyltransferase